MSAAAHMAQAAAAAVKITSTGLLLEANEKNYMAACITQNRGEQARLREERHTLTDVLLDQRGEQQHYYRLAILSTR